MLDDPAEDLILPTPEQGLVAHWRFDEKNGSSPMIHPEMDTMRICVVRETRHGSGMEKEPSRWMGSMIILPFRDFIILHLEKLRRLQFPAGLNDTGQQEGVI